MELIESRNLPGVFYRASDGIPYRADGTPITFDMMAHGDHDRMTTEAPRLTGHKLPSNWPTE